MQSFKDFLKAIFQVFFGAFFQVIFQAFIEAFSQAFFEAFLLQSFKHYFKQFLNHFFEHICIKIHQKSQNFPRILEIHRDFHSPSINFLFPYIHSPSPLLSTVLPLPKITSFPSELGPFSPPRQTQIEIIGNVSSVHRHPPSISGTYA